MRPTGQTGPCRHDESTRCGAGPRRLDRRLGQSYRFIAMGDSSLQPATETAPPLPSGILSRHPWTTFLLPFLVYMTVGTLEPVPPDPASAPPESVDQSGWLGIEYRHYPIIYTLKVAATLATMAFVWPGYRTFPKRVTGLGLLVGLVGGCVWIVLAERQFEAPLIEATGFDWIGGMGQRPAFNPLRELEGTAGLAYAFLAVRFVGLVLVVPVIEEFFYRGFLMRLVMDARWWEIPFGRVDAVAVVVGTAVPMLTHPGELLAAMVWFSLVTWLMVRTRNIWDCVLAHALANLMLGIYVLATGSWKLM